MAGKDLDPALTGVGAQAIAAGQTVDARVESQSNSFIRNISQLSYAEIQRINGILYAISVVPVNETPGKVPAFGVMHHSLVERRSGLEIDFFDHYAEIREIGTAYNRFELSSEGSVSHVLVVQVDPDAVTFFGRH